MRRTTEKIRVFSLLGYHNEEWNGSENVGEGEKRKEQRSGV